MKPWNLNWLLFLVNDEHDIRVKYVFGYLLKNFWDYIGFIPSLMSVIVLGFYDPIKEKKIINFVIERRRTMK